jgi:phage-related protein
MEKTIIIKPNEKTVSVLKKMVDLKEQHRKEVLARLKKK